MYSIGFFDEDWNDFPAGLIMPLASDAGQRAFGLKLELSGPLNPGYAGFVYVRLADRLKQLRDTANIFAVGESGAFVEASQYHFRQTRSALLVCATGESGRALLDCVLNADKEWREGAYLLFDSDGFVRE